MIDMIVGHGVAIRVPLGVRMKIILTDSQYGMANLTLLDLLGGWDQDGNKMISEDEFRDLLEQEEAQAAFEKLGVDLETFAQVGEYFFETARKDVEEKGEEGVRPSGVSLRLTGLQDEEDAYETCLTFDHFLTQVLQLRNDNWASPPM